MLKYWYTYFFGTSFQEESLTKFFPEKKYLNRTSVSESIPKFLTLQSELQPSNEIKRWCNETVEPIKVSDTLFAELFSQLYKKSDIIYFFRFFGILMKLFRSNVFQKYKFVSSRRYNQHKELTHHCLVS